MLNKGIVQEVDGKNLKILVYKDSACSHCSSCSEGNRFQGEFEFQAEGNVKKGDSISFEIEDKVVLNLAFLVYILPVIFLFFGYILSSKLGLSEGKRILSSFVSMFFSFVLLFFYDKSKGKQILNKKIKICKINEDDDEDIKEGGCS